MALRARAEWLQVAAGLGFHKRAVFLPPQSAGVGAPPAAAASPRSAPTTHACPRPLSHRKRAPPRRGEGVEMKDGVRGKGVGQVQAIQERSFSSWSQAHPALAFVVCRMSQGSPERQNQ